MNHIMLFENYFSNPTSKDSKELYNELLPLFIPSYNLERPSGHSLEIIEMVFNDNTKYENVKQIIEDSKWYVVKSFKRENGSVRKIEIRPTYSKFIKKRVPKYVYHISPSSNDESIMENGLLSRNDKKMGINYPDRIYVTSTIKSLQTFSKELNYYVGENVWTIWKIDLSDLGLDFLYVDETVNQNLSKPIAFYLQNVDVPTSNLNINKKIVL